MKKFLFYLFALIFSMGVFTACSSDDDVKYPVDEELAGAYKGSMDIYYEGIATPIAKNLIQKVYITKASDNAIKLELKDFSVTVAGVEVPIGTITIDKCALKQNGDNYSFTGSQELSIVVGKCNTSVSGTIGKGTIEMNILVDAVDAKLKVKVNFDGKKLTGSENTEAKITSFTFDSSLVTEQPVINEEEGKITFKVSDAATVEEIKKLKPVIVISDKATLIPAADVIQDFNRNVVYTVISEDATTKTYTVSISGKNVVLSFGFEEWGVGGMYPDIPITDNWASCNDAVGLIKDMGPDAGIEYTGEYPVRSTANCVSGQFAAEMESVDTKGGVIWGQKVPKVTSGTLFLGSFNAFAAFQNPMATTSFGIMYDKKPLKVKGFFKYIQGTEFYNAEGIPVVDGKDECAITAVLYEVNNEEETLDGSTIYDSPKIIASAAFNNAGTAEFTPFELDLKYSKVYDSTKKYKFAVIFASSKDGAAYNAAIGSKLTIDDVVIINE